MRSRRALLGLLVGGVAAGSGGVAEACTIMATNCAWFRAAMRNSRTLVRAYVSSSEPVALKEGELNLVAIRDVRARTLEVLSGTVRDGRVYAFQASTSDCNGLVLGHLPKRGETIVMALEWDKEAGDWRVSSTLSAAEFDRNVRRCGVA